MKQKKRILNRSFLLVFEVVLLGVMLLFGSNLTGTSYAKTANAFSNKENLSSQKELTVSEDSEEIRVLSVSVNTNTEENTVTTELILQNTGTKRKKVTFPLPVISAGMDVDSLSVKNFDGSDREAPDGVVTLSLKGGGFGGLTYTYRTAHSLGYDRMIAFDLWQLSEHFQDQIGHLEWTVDLPAYELVLLEEIEPVNYTISDNRVNVVLDHFSVSPLLGSVSLTRKTHMDLVEEVEARKEEVYDYEYEDAISFLGIYRKIYRMKEYPENYSGYSGTEFTILHNMDQVLRWSLDPEEQASIYDYPEAPFLKAQLQGGNPVVYAVLLTRQSELSGKELVQYHSLPNPDRSDPTDSREIVRVPIDEELLLKTPPEEQRLEKKYSQYRVVYLREEDFEDLDVVIDYLNALHIKAVVRSKLLVKGSDLFWELNPTEAGSNYLFSDANYSYDGTEEYPFESFEKDFKNVCKGYPMKISCTLLHDEEPLKDLIPVPILTLYWGYAYTKDGDTLVRPFRTNSLMASDSGILLIEKLLLSPVPKQMRTEHENELQKVVDVTSDLIDQARETLKNKSEEPEEETEEETIETSEAESEENMPETSEGYSDSDLKEFSSADPSVSSESKEKESKDSGEETTENNRSLLPVMVILILTGSGLILGTIRFVIGKRKKDKTK